MKLHNIMPGVQVYEGKKRKTLRYFATVGGQRYAAQSTLPYEAAVTAGNHKPSCILREDYANWVRSLNEKAGPAASRSRRCPQSRPLAVPTIKELAEAYAKIAAERSSNPLFGKPGPRAIYTCLNHYWHCVEDAGLNGERPVSELFDPNTVRYIFERAGRRKRAVSAWSQIFCLKSITAHWTLAKYEAMGMRVDPPRMPERPINAVAPQYKMLSPEFRRRIERWYASLGRLSDRRMYLAASMTYQLAMRPIDVGLLTAENFVEDSADGMMHLVYTPSKTARSSGRVVDWPILPELWLLIREVSGERLDAGKTLLESVRTVFNKINLSMRLACDIPTDRKAAYELRKLCIDTVRRVQGVDAAVAISGDRRETIDHYYSDPYKIVGVKPIAIAPMAEKERLVEVEPYSRCV